MHVTARRFVPFLIAGGAAAAIAVAPSASADQLSCTDVGNATQCSSPGNSQITANAPVVQQPPQVIIIHRNRF
jgi:hypothetical protein